MEDDWPNDRVDVGEAVGELLRLTVDDGDFETVLVGVMVFDGVAVAEPDVEGVLDADTVDVGVTLLLLVCVDIEVAENITVEVAA
jgi:hypothetical protein